MKTVATSKTLFVPPTCNFSSLPACMCPDTALCMFAWLTYMYTYGFYGDNHYIVVINYDCRQSCSFLKPFYIDQDFMGQAFRYRCYSKTSEIQIKKWRLIKYRENKNEIWDEIYEVVIRISRNSVKWELIFCRYHYNEVFWSPVIDLTGILLLNCVSVSNSDCLL